MKYAGVRRIFLLFLCALLVVSMAVPCFGMQQFKTTVRVGYVEMQNFISENEDGTYSGFAYDLMQEIGSVNNWEYEFFKCSYADCEKRFESGDLDIFLTYQKIPERAAVFEYSEEVFCTNRASIFTLSDSDISFDDFTGLENCRIGVVQGTRNGERFENYLEENGCHAEMVNHYSYQNEMKEAVRSGELDAFISMSNRPVSGFKIVSELPQTDSYVIAPKGERKYLDQIDSAIRKINLEMPYLVDSLEQRYQRGTDGCYPSLTEDEISYIKNKKNITVLIGASECDEDGNLAGSAKTFFENISRLTGLTFTPVVSDTTTAIMKDISEGKADIIYTFNRDFDWADKHNVWPTCSYASFYNKLIIQPNTSEINSVAVVPGSYIEYDLGRNTDYEMHEYKSYLDCVNAVLAGEVDAAYCTSPIGNYYSTFPKYSRLSFLTAYDFDTAYCMGVSYSSDQIIVDILNKAIQCIPSDTLSNVYELQMNSRPVVLSDFYYSNPIKTLLMLLIITAVILTFAFMMFYSCRIQKKNNQLASANGAKTDFMARMSHDMRTPMNGILGLTQLAKDEDDIDVIKSSLTQIELSGKVLLDLINDTLDMNKIESGNLKLNLKPIDSEEVFGNVLANAHIMAAEKGVQLEIHAPQIVHEKWVPVMADASRLEQILFNIISNAIKFTPEGGKVEMIMETVSITEDVVKDKYVIKDSGIGMSPEFLPHIFDSFAQERRSSDTSDLGTGLGMSIVKQLVDLMDSEIHVTSELDKGTEVTLLMKYPVYKGEIHHAEKQTSNPELLRGKNILLCEDHPINAQISIKLLEKYGVNVDVAENGKIGVEMFVESDENHYDAILMDIRMPVMDGIESAKAIRLQERPDAKTVPIIAMTANAFEDDVKNCLEAGMNDHLSKPIEANLMYQILIKHISDAELRRSR